MFLLFLNLLMV